VSAKLAQAFLRAAEEDLTAARRLLPDLPRPAGYHLQQAAETLAKAMLAEAGMVPVPRYTTSATLRRSCPCRIRSPQRWRPSPI
jgi:HEPN domain-containing protein